MNRDNSGEIYVTPVFIVRENVSLGFTLNPDEEIALIHYLVRKRGRSIRWIIPVYHPIILLDIFNDYAIPVNPLSTSKFVLRHKCPRIDHRVIDELNTDDIEGFINELSKIYKHLKEAIRKAEVKTYTLYGIIDDIDAVEELKSIIQYINIHPRRELVGIILPDNMGNKELDRDRETINNILKHIEEDILEINTLKNQLDEKYHEWMDNLEKVFNIRFGEVKKSIDATHRIVEEKISILRAKYTHETMIVKDKYRSIRDLYNAQKYTIESEIKELQAKIENTRNPKLRSHYKNLISELRKHQKNIEEKIRKSIRDEEREIKSIKEKYDKLIRNEERRLKHIMDEKNKLLRRKNTIINKAEELINKINNLLNSIIEDRVREEGRIHDLMIQTPYSGAKIYLKYYIIGLDNGKTIIYWPSVMSQRILNDESFNIKTYKNLVDKVLAKKAKEIISGKGKYSKPLKELDVLNRYSIEEIKSILRKLSLREEFFEGINIYVFDEEH